MTVIGIDASRAALAQHTGTETYAHQLILSLAKLTTGSNIQLRLYTHQVPQHQPWPSAPHVETRTIPWPRLWTHLRLAAEISRHPPDVLFVPAHVLPLYCPVPAAVTVHDVGYKHFPAAHTGRQRRYLAWSTRRHTRVAQAIIADSEATRRDLQDVYHADPTRIYVVPLGLDPTLQRTPSDMVRQKYKLQYDYLLYLGTLQPRKNLVRLVKAFAAIAPQHPHLQLVLAGGKGWDYDEIFATVHQSGLTDKVVFTGFVPAAEKAALLSGAFAYIHPSLFEGFGLPVLEAMACGTPVVCSNTSSLPEVAGNAAILVDPLSVDAIASGIQTVLNNQNRRQQLIDAGYAQAKKFSWASTAQTVLNILLNLTSETQ